jgi:mRNA interferase RelE/StbE
MPRQNSKGLQEKIKRIAGNPGRQDVPFRKLRGQRGFRVRQGDYRAIFDIDPEAGTLTVLDADHRSRIYK